MEMLECFFGHLEHFTAIWYILWPIGNLVVIWYIFPRFGILCLFSSPVSTIYGNDGKGEHER
jgi:hypothetical protein